MSREITVAQMQEELAPVIFSLNNAKETIKTFVLLYVVLLQIHVDSRKKSSKLRLVKMKMIHAGQP